MGEVSLELLQSMMQRVLDTATVMRGDLGNIRRRLGRLEHAVLALQRTHIDRLEGDAGTQDQIDELTRRIEPVEQRVN